MLRLIIAIILTLLQPGLGQFVNGQRLKGIFFFVLAALGIILKYTVSPLPVILLYIVALADVLFVYIRIMKGKQSAPSGGRSIAEVVISVVLAALALFIVEEITIKLSSSIGMSRDEELAIQQETEKYLTQKYGKEFTVDNVKYVWQIGEYRMQGKPKENGSLKFFIKKEKGGQTIEDQYFYEYMTVQSREEIKPFIEKMYPKSVSWSSTVTIDEDVEKIFSREMPDYVQLRQKTNGYYQNIRIFLIKDIRANKLDEELNNLFQLVSYLKNQRIRAGLDIQYFDESLLDQGVQTVTLDNHAKYQDQLQGMLELEDVFFSKIESPQDLKRYLKTY
ncbi:hypothetical protein [Effusibacillus lacus]|uniref:Uncharacterized protein n=1 Tax=Effusibacillus lacus TaxID=1348429 RepID=A0A292YLV6_9BACL|nr:hypothetical protein [Effusibacillus lacus]TCS71262.1 hypothetical protein EDD64_12762 [Effusibacillus lacus]GAX89889.1 hypothetical protein EFBL_1514 [Effusibacillus lacus]